MKKKKLFIEDLERRRSTSPLFVSTQAVGENGTVSKDKMPEYGGREFKKPNAFTVKYAPPEPGPIVKYAPPEPGPIVKYAPPNPGPIVKYAPPEPGPIYTTQAVGEEGNSPKR